MEDYFFKIFTPLRNCNVACSPALRLEGASEQLSGLCFRSHPQPFNQPWSAPHLILADHDGLAVRFDSISRVTKDDAVDDDAIAAEFRAYRERSAQLPLTSRSAAAQIRFADKVARLANVKPI